MIVLTMKLPIVADRETRAALKETVREYTGSFNRVCAEGWNMKRLNGVELHKLTYASERASTPLSSQLVCSARVKATEAVKSAKSLLKKNKKASCPRSGVPSGMTSDRQRSIWPRERHP